MKLSTRKQIWASAFFVLAVVELVRGQSANMLTFFLVAVILFEAGDILKALDK